MKPNESFLTRKKLLFLVIGVVGVYLVLNIASYAVSRQTKVVKVKETQTENVSKYQNAINKTEDYLKNSGSSVDISQRLILDYLQRKFDLDPKLGTEGTPLFIPQSSQTYPQEIHFLERIANPNSIVKVPPKSSIEGISYLNITAANCDYKPLPSNYWNTIRDSLRAGGYNLTHVALALAFIQDNGCNKPADIDDINEKLTSGMVSIANDNPKNMDLRFEAIAFLMLSGRYDLVDSSWIDEIIASQAKNGSWTDKTGQAKTDHITVLALWALLEYEHADEPYEPLIRRPSAGN